MPHPWPMLAVTHDSVLVLCAVAVAVMAAFAGLNLTAGLGSLASGARKGRIAMAAVALGGGIWSTHFIAMLALRLPVPIAFDPLTTLGSALVAILLCGLGLIVLHAGPRRPARIAAAGTVMGVGVVLMHYIGMAGLRGCGVVYGPLGFLVASLAAIGISIAALAATLISQPRRALAGGALALGLAVVAMHFSAMAWTGFVATEAPALAEPLVDRALLALIVAVTAFAICGGFLLSAVSLDAPPAPVAAPPPQEAAEKPVSPPVRIPYQKGGRTLYVDAPEVAAVRAEGHYTILYGRDDELFCPWSISEAEAQLPADQFLRAHRSYLLNLTHVSGLERHRDSGLCRIEGFATLRSAPVARARFGTIRDRLGLHT